MGSIKEKNTNDKAYQVSDGDYWHWLIIADNILVNKSE